MKNCLTSERTTVVVVIQKDISCLYPRQQSRKCNALKVGGASLLPSQCEQDKAHWAITPSHIQTQPFQLPTQAPKEDAPLAARARQGALGNHTTPQSIIHLLGGYPQRGARMLPSLWQIALAEKYFWPGIFFSRLLPCDSSDPRLKPFSSSRSTSSSLYTSTSSQTLNSSRP